MRLLAVAVVVLIVMNFLFTGWQFATARRLKKEENSYAKDGLTLAWLIGVIFMVVSPAIILKISGDLSLSLGMLAVQVMMTCSAYVLCYERAEY